MNPALLHARLLAFIAAANTHQHLDREHRIAWRYRHKQEEIRPHKREALRIAERAAAELHQTIADLAEPDYLSRTARALLEKWDAYRRNHNIMVAEYNGENQKRTATSRNTLETALKDTTEILQKLATN